MEVTGLIEQVRGTSGLDENQAKALVFWAIATHGQTKLQTFPIMVIQGSYGTGKTTILNIVAELAYEAYTMDGKVTPAAFRDALRLEHTALVDEADKISEGILVNRYLRNAGQVTVKRQVVNGWYQEALGKFGATVLVRRKPVSDGATLSRAIVITTRRQSDVEPYDAESFREYQEPVKRLGADIPWDDVKPVRGGRIADTWETLRFVAAYLGDTDWLAWADVQIEKAQANLRLGQGEEPTQAAYCAMLALALEGRGSEPADRVPVRAIVMRMNDEGHQDINSWQVGSMMRDMGFDTKTEGGTQYVKTGGTEKLARTGRELGVQDEWIDSVLATEGMKV